MSDNAIFVVCLRCRRPIPQRKPDKSTPKKCLDASGRDVRRVPSLPIGCFDANYSEHCDPCWAKMVDEAYAVAGIDADDPIVGKRRLEGCPSMGDAGD